MKRLLVLLALTAMLGAIAPAGAAPAVGMSYDELMKFAMGDPSTLQPGNFDADFQTAAQPPPPTKGGGGMFGGLNAMVAQAQGSMAMFKTGLATSHYIAGAKERVDYPAMQQATITDCDARTIAKLDLKNKTYTLVSMDQPAPTGGTGGRGRPSGGPSSTDDDGSKIAIALTNQALGPRDITGVTTDGYQSNVAMTITRPSGESSTSNMALTEYLAKMSQISLSCPAAGMLGATGPAAMGMGQYSSMMRAMSLGGKDPRFTVTSSGPALPSNRFAMFAVTTMTAPGRGGQSGSFGMATQHGHVASVRSDDTIFQIPPDFTKTGP
jgi:hypothetical protein